MIFSARRNFCKFYQFLLNNFFYDSFRLLSISLSLAHVYMMGVQQYKCTYQNLSAASLQARWLAKLLPSFYLRFGHLNPQPGVATCHCPAHLPPNQYSLLLDEHLHLGAAAASTNSSNPTIKSQIFKTKSPFWQKKISAVFVKRKVCGDNYSIL